VFRSTDRGDHWTAASTGLGNLRVDSLAIDPSTPATLYAATAAGSVFRSTDRGDHWTGVNNGLPGSWATSLAIDPADPTNLYLGTLNGLFRSTDRGDHWTAVNAGRIDSVVIDPANPATLYVGTYLGVFRSTDRGDHWTEVNTGLTHVQVHTLAIDPATHDTLYVGTEEGGAFRSTDGGDHWTAVNTGITNLNVSSLAIDPSTSAILYAGAGANGVFRSTDRAGHWTAVNTGLPASVTRLAIDPVTPATLYAGTTSGVFRSTDRGEHWAAVNTGLPNLTILSLAIDPVTPAILYAGTSGGGAFRSTDRGDHWTTVADGLTNPHVRSLAIDPATPTTLYAGTEAGLFFSTDRGEHWTAIYDGLPKTSVPSLAIDPINPANVYAVLGTGVFRSTDRGAHWTPVSSGLTAFSVTSIAIDPKSPATLYAAADLSGVFRTTDRGNHWTAINRGLRVKRASRLAIDPASSAVYAAGDYGGVFRLDWDCALHFSQLGNGSGLTSDVVITNPSASSPVSGTIAVAGDSGLPMSVGLPKVDFSILPLGTQTLSTNGLGGLAVGSAAIGADGVLGGVVRFSMPGIGIAGVGASDPTPGFITPVRRNAAINTGVAFSNPGLQAINLSLSLRNLQGQEVSGGQRTIQDFPARGHLAQFIHELFPEAQTEGFEGSLVITVTDGGITATALELGQQPGHFTTLPVIPLATGSAASKFSFAQFGGGQGFTSDTLLVNPSADRSVNGTVNFYDDLGQAMPVVLQAVGNVTSQTFSIPPLGMLRISTEGAGALKVGSASVSADGPVGGVVRFQIPGSGIAGVGSCGPLTRLLIPVRRTAAGIRTGIALQNCADAPTSVTLTLRSASGAAIATHTIENFPARAHAAKFVEELFDAVTGEFQGTLSIEVAGGAIAATALELGSKPGEFTTLPVTPIE